jgi:pilus assembly protein FimV
MSYLPYLGGLILAVLAGLFFWRRKNAGQQEGASATSTSDDPFSGVKLQSTAVEVEAPEASAPVTAVAQPAAESAADAPSPESEEAPGSLSAGGERGYGQRKHDDYSSHDEDGDALAEVDIYVAYGRLPQAVDLLKSAVRNDPDNTSYRLRLIELGQEMGNAELVAEHYGELQRINDPQALAGAKVLMEGGEAPATQSEAVANVAADDQLPLEDTFSGLEIEGSDSDDLDLSADFAEVVNDVPEEEDLVFAEEGNPMSTKLDLARAYLDMGDEDGAKLILDEVIAEGSDEQQQEARALIDRIG